MSILSLEFFWYNNPYEKDSAYFYNENMDAQAVVWWLMHCIFQVQQRPIQIQPSQAKQIITVPTGSGVKQVQIPISMQGSRFQYVRLVSPSSQAAMAAGGKFIFPFHTVSNYAKSCYLQCVYIFNIWRW